MGFFSSIGSLFGLQQQKKGIKKSQEIQSTFQKRLLDFQERVFAEGAPFREISLDAAKLALESQETLIPLFTAAAEEATGLILEDIARPIGESPIFEEARRVGAREIGKGVTAALAPFGLAESSITAEKTAEAIQDFETNLLLNELRDIRGARFKVAGLPSGAGPGVSPTTGVGEATDLLRLAGAPTTAIAKSAAELGAVRGQQFETGADIFSDVATFFTAGGA